MASPLYILCPGQGAQVVPMGKDFADAFAPARELFEIAHGVLGYDLLSICAAGPEETLNKTDVSQPAIYVTSIACYRAAVAQGAIEPSQVTAYAGLSLGEYTALHLGGAFGFEEGLRLVAARGKYMQQAAEATPSGMLAVLGADEAQVRSLCDQASQGEVLVPANFNAPGQIICSGSNAACGRLATIAEAAGFKTKALVVAGAFHSPIMQSGADRMAHELAQVNFAPLNTTVYSNVTAAPHGDAATIKSLLVDQIVSPVRWEQTMTTLAADAQARFVELAPGRVLSGMLKKINRRALIVALSSADTLAAPKAPQTA